MPVFYQCQRCAACCRWPGEVRVEEGEISRIAAQLGLDDRAFIQRFTRLTRDRRGLSLTEKPNGECIFLDGAECAIQPVKPQQCLDFPNLWRFPGFDKTCQAVPFDVDAAAYRGLIGQATGRTPETVPLPRPETG